MYSNSLVPATTLSPFYLIYSPQTSHTHTHTHTPVCSRARTDHLCFGEENDSSREAVKRVTGILSSKTAPRTVTLFDHVNVLPVYIYNQLLNHGPSQEAESQIEELRQELQDLEGILQTSQFEMSSLHEQLTEVGTLAHQHTGIYLMYMVYSLVPWPPRSVRVT